MKPEQLRQIIERFDLSVSSAAKLLGVHRVSVHKWLSGKTPISAAATALIRERLK